MIANDRSACQVANIPSGQALRFSQVEGENLCQMLLWLFSRIKRPQSSSRPIASVAMPRQTVKGSKNRPAGLCLSHSIWVGHIMPCFHFKLVFKHCLKCFGCVMLNRVLNAIRFKEIFLSYDIYSIQSTLLYPLRAISGALHPFCFSDLVRYLSILNSNL